MAKLFSKLVLITFLLITGCAKKNIDDENSVVIGTIAGPETELVEVAKEVAMKKYNLSVTIKAFNDYVEPNRALADGDINVNMFQHQPYLDDVVKTQNYKLVSIGELFIYPVGIYSQKYKKIDDIPDNAIVALPNDASNQARSLLLLEQAGLIKLDSNKSREKVSVHDVAENIKKLKFKEVDPAFMVRMLSDLDIAVINTNYAAIANLLPNRDALFAENKKSLYANILVVREEDKNKEKFNKLLQALRSKEVLQTADKIFNGQALQAW